MSASFNKVVLAGNLTRDPELRFTKNGIPVCELGIAVNRVRSKDRDEADFFNVIAWRELGETIANYKVKGDPILVKGRLQYSSWQTDDGSRRSKVEVVAENVQFLGAAKGNDVGGGSGSQGATGNAQGGRTTSSSGGSQATTVEVDEDFDDIPF